MNIRGELNKKKRIAWLSTIGGFGLIFLSAVFIPSDSKYIILIGFAVFLFAVYYSHFRIRCPVCKGNMGQLVMFLGSPFLSSKNIKYCPFCGVNIDTGINNNIS